jgi:DNA-directed RNA polymerase specialized sigma24 family protein
MPKPNVHRRLELLRRRQAIADLYVQGFSQMAIAERLGISQATVSADLKQIRREWRESAIRDFDHAQDRELAKIDRGTDL